jgi:hypothetical protein
MRGGSARAVAIACGAYAALAIVYTWPLAARLGGIPHDAGDPLLNTWILWWSGTQALPLTDTWWNAPMFVPAAGVLAYSEHLVGLVPIATPFTLLTGQPLVGYNVTFIATFFLSALGAHWLAYTLTRRHDVAAIAAIAFAFAPYRLGQVAHIQVLASFWTPICLAALHRYRDTFRTRWAVAAAAAWLLQGLSCGYFTLFLGALVALWFCWYAIGQWPARRLAIALGAFAVAAAAQAPFLHGYQVILRDTYGLRRGIGEMRVFSADVASLLSASEDLWLWGWLRVIQRPEAYIFPGLTMVVLTALAMSRARPFTGDAAESRTLILLRRVLVAVFAVLLLASALPFMLGPWQLSIGGVRLVSIARGDKPLSLALAVGLAIVALLPGVRAAWRRCSAIAFYLLTAFVTWIFALGPDPTLMNQPLLYRAPYSWLMLLPGFDGLRVPARFWTMTLVCLAAIGALAVHRLEGRRRRTVVAIALAGLLLDGWPGRFMVVAAPPLRPAPAGTAVRLDLPVTPDNDAAALYRQMFERTPLYNGMSGFAAPHYPAMTAMLDEHDREGLAALAARGPVGVVIDHAGDADGALRAMVAGFPGASQTHTEAGWSSYSIPRGPQPAVAEETGTPLPIARVAASRGKSSPERAIDGNVDTSWNGDTQQTPVTFTIELNSPSAVAQVVLDLGPYFSEFPARLRIDVSNDGTRWDTAWTGSGALPVYHAAVRHPRRVPAVFPIGREDVRFIRLEQIGSSKADWSIAEVRVRR